MNISRQQLKSLIREVLSELENAVEEPAVGPDSDAKKLIDIAREKAHDSDYQMPSDVNELISRVKNSLGSDDPSQVGREDGQITGQLKNQAQKAIQYLSKIVSKGK